MPGIGMRDAGTALKALLGNPESDPASALTIGHYLTIGHCSFFVQSLPRIGPVVPKCDRIPPAILLLCSVPIPGVTPLWVGWFA